jgi:hypothetical protein
MEQRLQDQQDELRRELGETRQMLLNYLVHDIKEE